ncbi:MAG: DNA-3-methyladenine glycosylase [Acidobacteriia bacterium]|nr:DNA-3-methyladenine glycosylase [Terriglobia bacterium]
MNPRAQNAPLSGRLLPRSFFNRDPRVVARALLGKLIVRKQRGKFLVGRIVEVEAYLGSSDAAAHAAAGRTARNAVLWGPPGHAYVYFIYGMYYCLNISCMPDGKAGCVLIRAMEPVAGIEQMADARGIELLGIEGTKPHSVAMRDLRRLTSGPGRLCEALGITRPRDNGKDMVSPKSDLQVRDDGFRAKKIAVTTRIGIRKSAEMPLRYVIAGNQFVSKK